jgi:hypothetical protein
MADAPSLPDVAPEGIAPHLRQLMADYAATGMPPAYLPKDHASAPMRHLADLDDTATDDACHDNTTDTNTTDQEEPR